MQHQKTVLIDNRKVEVLFHTEKELVTIQVTEEDGYSWSIERMPLSVAKTVSKELQFAIGVIEES